MMSCAWSSMYFVKLSLKCLFSKRFLIALQQILSNGASYIVDADATNVNSISYAIAASVNLGVKGITFL